MAGIGMNWFEWLEIAGRIWKWLEIFGNGWKQQELLKMHGNGWKWMVMFELAKYGRKWLEKLEMKEIYGLLEITLIHFKQLEITENCQTRFYDQKCLGRLDMAKKR